MKLLALLAFTGAMFFASAAHAQGIPQKPPGTVVIQQPTAAAPSSPPSAPADRDKSQGSGSGMALLFWGCVAITIGGSLFVISRRNLIAAVMGMVGTFFGVAALYMMLYAHFLAVIQMLVYAGAIMVLFVFVVMILNKPEDEPWALTGLPGKVLAGIAMLYLTFRLGQTVWGVHPPAAALAAPPPIIMTEVGQVSPVGPLSATKPPTPWATGTSYAVGDLISYRGETYYCLQAHQSPQQVVSNATPDAAKALWLPVALYSWGSSGAVGDNLFTEYLFPFEAISILLLVAVVGAIAVARPFKDDEPSVEEAAS